MPRQACQLMAGPTSQDDDFWSQADYKDWQALKSCRSEFRHIPLMWILQTGERYQHSPVSFLPHPEYSLYTAQAVWKQ